MASYNDIIAMVDDELKNVSDDGHFTGEHIAFLLRHYRCFLLKQRYSDVRKAVPESNYQTITVGLDNVSLPGEDNEYVSCHMLKSVEKVPQMMTTGRHTLASTDLVHGLFNYVDSERFRYAGQNIALKNQVYGSIMPDSHLYLKSMNPQAYYIENVTLTGMFEDVEAASALSPDAGNYIDVLDMPFPLEDSLVPPMIELVVKEFSGAKFQPKDSMNNANDDLSDLAAFLRQQLNEGRRSQVYKNL